jgi:hypothetical protein
VRACVRVSVHLNALGLDRATTCDAGAQRLLLPSHFGRPLPLRACMKRGRERERESARARVRERDRTVKATVNAIECLHALVSPSTRDSSALTSAPVPSPPIKYLKERRRGQGLACMQGKEGERRRRRYALETDAPCWATPVMADTLLVEAGDEAGAPAVAWPHPEQNRALVGRALPQLEQKGILCPRDETVEGCCCVLREASCAVGPTDFW